MKVDELPKVSWIEARGYYEAKWMVTNGVMK